MVYALLPVPHCPNCQERQFPCIHMHARRAYVVVARDGDKMGIHLPGYNSSIFYSLNVSLDPLRLFAMCKLSHRLAHQPDDPALTGCAR